MKTYKLPRFVGLAVVVLSIAVCSEGQQVASASDRDRGLEMLTMVRDDLKDKYYDRSLHGMDLEARFKAAKEKMKTATSNGQIMGIIAQMMLDMGDSHTFFLPPARANRTEYGWKVQMFGDRPFVIAVKPKSDAEAKGLKVGDEVLTIDGNAVTRDNLWTMQYLYYSLRPKPGMKVTVRHPDGKQEELAILAKVTEGRTLTLVQTGWNGTSYDSDAIRERENEEHLMRQRFTSSGSDVFIWKMPAFDLTNDGVDDMIDKARKCKALIIDLRGNSGGAVTTLNRLVGNLFDHDIKIADWKGRKKFDPQVAKSRGKNFDGKLAVLIDNGSASASEIFARVIQLEKRGIVLGDRSSGSVMVSMRYDHEVGLDQVAFFATSVTEADLIMTDGKSL
ncbi:MAG TPA: S41 family peptidase, partial [Pyrinomonadaceae bacterium]|nr:S41 family peptidase [Pyrinomonadaceae bacterium]